MQSNIPFEIQYLNLLKILVKKLEAQPPRQDRTGVGTASVFGHSFDIDISDMSVPLLTTKKVAYKTAIRELYWMYVLKNPDMSYLKEHNIKIWDEWAVYNEEHPQGTIGKIYGQVLGDSVQYAIDLLKERPGSRRALFSTYDKDAVALEHLSFEENVKQGRGVLNACFTKGHAVLMADNSYKDISEISVGDFVISDNLGVNVVSDVSKVPCSSLVKLSVYKTPKIYCTKEHPFYVYEKGWTRADNISKGDYIKILSPPPVEKSPQLKAVVKRNQFLTRELEITPSEDLYYLLGYYTGNGCLVDAAPTRVSLAVPVKTLKEILEILERLGLHACVCKGSSEKQKVLNISSAWLSSILRENFSKGAFNKSVPEFVRDSPKPFVKAFLKGYARADGYLRGTTYRITTISPSLAFGVSRLYHKVGFLSAGALFQKRPETHSICGRIVSQKDTYSIECSTDPIKSNYISKDGDIYYKVTSLEQVDTSPSHDGYVYNLTVDGSHTYSVNNVITHNCHGVMTQLYINDDGELEMCSYQRSADILLGNPINVAFYATLAHIIAHELGTKAVRLVYHLGDAHLYANHLEAAKEQLSRPLLPCRPYIELDESIKGLSTFTPEGITLYDYQHQGAIKAQVAV